MRMGRVILALALAGALPAAAEIPAPTEATLVVAALKPMPRPAAPDPEVRCTADGGLCIRLSSYVPDVCGAIEAAARQNGLDPNFFVRLIWKGACSTPPRSARPGQGDRPIHARHR